MKGFDDLKSSSGETQAELNRPEFKRQQRKCH